MRCTEEIMIEIFNDNNIDRNEKYMLLMFIANNKDNNEFIEMSLNIIIDYFQYKSKEKITAVLRSLENKKYIEIIKESGKVNKYKLMKYSYYEKVNNQTGIYKHEYRDLYSENSSFTTSHLGQTSGEKMPSGSDHLEQTSGEKLPSGSGHLEHTSGEKLPSGSGHLEHTSSEKITGTSIIKQPGGSYNISTGTDENIISKSLESIENREFAGEVISFEQKKSLYNNINNNNINNNIYINNKLYINIFNTWNKASISIEKIMSNEIKKVIYNSLELYGEEEIIKAIENYSEVFNSNHYYNYRWNLLSFLAKQNGIKRFMENGDMWLDYKSKKQDTNDNFDDDFDIQKYIDY